MKRIVITGATGFVGKQVMKSLKSSACSLTLVTRDPKHCNKLSQPNLERIVVTKDVFAESPEWWENVLEDSDIVIHLAWFVEPGIYLSSPKNLDCLQGSLNLMHGAVKANVKKVVGVGTCFEYDLTGNLPLSVDAPLKPLTLYASAKAALYMYLTQWLELEGVEFAWCRLFYLYGEGEDGRRLIPYLRSKLSKGEKVELTSGTQIRDFIDVSNAGQMIADIAMSSACGPQNICSGVPIAVRQIAENIADEYGRRDLLMFNARPDNAFDPPFVVGKRV